jgi:hypothetical protein
VYCDRICHQLHVPCTMYNRHGEEGQTIRAGWASDPVHPNGPIYAKMTLNLIEKVAGATAPQTAATGGRKRSRISSTRDEQAPESSNRYRHSDRRASGSGSDCSGGGGSGRYWHYDRQQRVRRRRRSNNRPQRGLENKGRQVRVWPTRSRRNASPRRRRRRRRRCKRPRRHRRLWFRRLQLRKKRIPLLGGYRPEPVAVTGISLIQIVFFLPLLVHNCINMSSYSAFSLSENITQFLNVVSYICT